jgi:hypothetical protein
VVHVVDLRLLAGFLLGFLPFLFLARGLNR